MSTADTATLIGVLSAAGASILTVLFTKGVDAFLKLRTDKRIDVVREANEVESGFKYIIAKQDARITQLEHDLCAVEAENLDCQKKYEALCVRFEVLETQMKERIGRGRA